MFWTWDSTLATILHRELLLDTLSAERDATSSAPREAEAQFCSDFLINSMLAVSMGFFFKSTDFDEPPTHRDFADEAFRLFASQDHAAQLPLLQGIAIMSIYEQAFGDPLRAIAFISNGFHYLDVKMELIVAPATPPSRIPWINSIRDEVPLSKKGEMIDALWIPHPISTQPQLSYYNDALEAEHELILFTEPYHVTFTQKIESIERGG
ncbi:fungal specific transcription factor [Hirsutella rhossiliensis]